ncbi:MAG: Gfo/Idh/MocA family oxidoreductase [Fimbriimonadaceae bacterium]|nr:Gfo/Idh/MocA family oxidoreductase [Fimbriimonadaceae bacterium]
MGGTLKFGVIGVGVPNQNLGGHGVYNGIGEVHGHFLRETAGAELIACCDLNATNGQAYAAKYDCEFYQDYAQMLARPDLDAVAICTPSGLHGQHAVEAIRAGKHVVVEKPLEITLARVDAILQAVEAEGVRAVVVFPTRYQKSFVAAKQALDDGRFGTPALIQALCRRYRDDVYYQGWRGTWSMDGGGACINQGVHMIDALLYLMDDIEAVQARYDTLGHDRNLCEVEDTAVAILQVRRGTLGVIEATTCAYNDFGDRIDIHGMKGSLSFAGSKLVDWQMRDEEFTFNPADYEPERHEEFHGHRLLYREVVPYLRDGAPCRCAVASGRKAIALIEAIYQSARHGGMEVRPEL